MRRPPTTIFLGCTVAAFALGACTSSSRHAAPVEAQTLRERIAALTLRQSDFGSVSLLPVRFEGSRLAGPIVEGGRTYYCVSSRMFGRNFGKPERPKVVIEDAGGTLKVADDEDLCEGHRKEPFPELEAAAQRS